MDHITRKSGLHTKRTSPLTQKKIDRTGISKIIGKLLAKVWLQENLADVTDRRSKSPQKSRKMDQPD